MNDSWSQVKLRIWSMAIIGAVSTVLSAQPRPVPTTTLVLNTADTAPLVNEYGNGLYQLLLQEVAARLSITIEIRRAPSIRSLSDAAAGLVDGEFGRTTLIAAQNPSLIRIEEPMSDFSFAAFGHSELPGPFTWSNLHRYRVAHIRGWRVVEQALANHPQLTVVETEDQLFNVLRVRRVDLIIYDSRRGAAWLRRNQGTGIAQIGPPVETQPMFLYLHQRASSWAGPIAATLQSIRADGTYNRLHTVAMESP